MMPSSPQLSSGGHSHGASMDGMTGALSSTAWLRELSSAVSVEPSKSLLRILRSCCPDKVDETVARVKELSEAVFPDEDDGGIMSQRREEAVKVYYRVLEAVLLGEERRTGVANITGLLNSNSFHRCLLACAAEVIIACYKMIVMPFPEVLERLGLKAFDIFKIIQCFVRHEPTLPRDIKRHLVSIEEQVVESMAWSAGSSLYPTLISAKLQLDDSSGRRQQVRQRKRTLTFSAADENEGRGPGESAPAPFNDKGIPAGLAKLKTRASSVQHHAVSASKPPVSPRTGELSTPNKVAGSVSSDISPGSPVTAGAESSVFHLIASPMPKKLRMDDSGVASSAGSPGLQAHPASTVMRSALPREIGEAIESPTSRDGPVVLLIRDFFKKATILSAVRLAQLCEHIAFGPYDHADILAKVYHVMRSCLFEHTHLLYGRHLDQLLLCSLYGVCKVLRLDHVTFKEITTHYKKQHSSSNHGSSGIPRQEIFRNVVIKFAENSLQPAEVGDIITFYNKVRQTLAPPGPLPMVDRHLTTCQTHQLVADDSQAFIPTMKDFLVHVSSETPRSSAQPNDSGNPGPSMVSRTAPGTPPGLGRRSAVVAASPLRKCSGRGDQFPVPLSPHKTQVSADCNVFVSPMRKYEAQMTPRTKSLFCVGAVGDTSMNSPAALAMALSEAAQAVPCQRGGLEWQLGPQAFQENKQEPGSPSMSDGKVPGDSGSSGAENMEF